MSTLLRVEADDLRYLIIEERHIEWARQVHNEHDTLLFLHDVTHVSQDAQREWFRRVSAPASSSKRYIVEIWDECDWQPAGIFRVDNLDLINRSVMVGLDIDPSYRGIGISKLAYEHFHRYFFNSLGINRVHLKVIESNVRAISLYRDMGYVEEGRERQAVYRDGKFIDGICMSLLREEWVDRHRNSVIA